MGRRPQRLRRAYCTEWRGGKPCVKLHLMETLCYWELRKPALRRSFKFDNYESSEAAIKAAKTALYKEQLARGRLKNRYRIWYGNNVVEMQTTKRAIPSKGLPARPGITFFFDLADLEKVLAGPVWTPNSKNYLTGWTKPKSPLLCLQRYLLDYSGQLDVDHIDRNPTNNTRSNLRIVSRRVNLLNRPLQSNNTSGENGIRKTGNRWMFVWGDGTEYYQEYFPFTDEGLDAARDRRSIVYAKIGSTNGYQ